MWLDTSLKRLSFIDVIICLTNKIWQQITVPRICSPFISVTLLSYDLGTRDLRDCHGEYVYMLLQQYKLGVPGLKLSKTGWYQKQSSCNCLVPNKGLIYFTM